MILVLNFLLIAFFLIGIYSWNKNYSELKQYSDKREKELIELKNKLNNQKLTLENKYLVKLKDNNLIGIKQNTIKEIYFAYTQDYPLAILVSMTSACDNLKDDDLFYNFYILVSSNKLKESDKNILKSLEKRYKKCKISFVDVEKKLHSLNLKNFETKTKFYTLFLPSLLSNIKRVIYLHEDTIILDNLEEMYNLQIMEDKFIAGYLDPYNIKKGFEEKFQVKSQYYLCTGVTLWNLELMRKRKIEEKFIKYLEEHNDKDIQYSEQEVINYICNNNTIPLPPKFGMFSYVSYKELYNYLKSFPKEEAYYGIHEHMVAFANPSIVHLPSTRAWEIVSLPPHGDNFIKYLHKTDYFHEHLKNYLENLNEK